jgi:hypothetical protein
MEHRAPMTFLPIRGFRRKFRNTPLSNQYVRARPCLNHETRPCPNHYMSTAGRAGRLPNPRHSGGCLTLKHHSDKGFIDRPSPSFEILQTKCMPKIQGEVKDRTTHPLPSSSVALPLEKQGRLASWQTGRPPAPRSRSPRRTGRRQNLDQAERSTPS